MSRVLDRAFDHPLKPEEKASAPLAGGIMQYGYQCGMIWGAALSAGAEAHRQFGSGPKAESAAIEAARRIVESFRSLNDHINCLEITELDRSSTTMQMIKFFLIKGGTIGCFRRAARYAPVAYREVRAALAADDIEVPEPPVSCASIVAKKMGASEVQTVMAAGFAGGIGLCGGACGAMGAAIWMISLEGLKKPGGKVAFRNPRAQALIDAFLKRTDCRFQCANIVGRKFDSVSDHAAFLREGGCSEIIETLVGA